MSFGPTGENASNVIARYQRCTQRLLDLFGRDPLPPEDAAHFLVERLESLLDRGLLAPALLARPEVRKGRERWGEPEIAAAVKVLDDEACGTMSNTEIALAIEVALQDASR